MPCYHFCKHFFIDILRETLLQSARVKTYLCQYIKLIRSGRDEAVIGHTVESQVLVGRISAVVLAFRVSIDVMAVFIT